MPLLHHSGQTRRKYLYFAKKCSSIAIHTRRASPSDNRGNQVWNSSFSQISDCQNIIHSGLWDVLKPTLAPVKVAKSAADIFYYFARSARSVLGCQTRASCSSIIPVYPVSG